MNRYRLGETIGQGGMALVNEATRQLADDTPQPIAIKRIQPEHEVHPLAQARFRLEAAIGLALAHPHLVKVFDYDRCGLDLCIVMEHVDGLSLRDLAQCASIPHDVVRLVLLDIAMALAYVHDEGFLHRDVSPSNILLSRRGAVKLADFGHALDLRQPRTTPGFKGTPAYASPEGGGAPGIAAASAPPRSCATAGRASQASTKTSTSASAHTHSAPRRHLTFIMAVSPFAPREFDHDPIATARSTAHQGLVRPPCECERQPEP